MPLDRDPNKNTDLLKLLIKNYLTQNIPIPNQYKPHPGSPVFARTNSSLDIGGFKGPGVRGRDEHCGLQQLEGR